MKTVKNFINEQSLSRVWQHNEGDYPVSIFTAFRGNFSYKENKKRNKQLAAKVRKLGYGFFYVDGYWIENEGTPQEEHVSEDSIFVIGKDASDEAFIKQICDLAKEFDQDGALIKTSDGKAGIYDNGKQVANIGKWNPNKIGENYTRLRGKGNKNRTFVFESAKVEGGFINHYIETRKES